MKRARPSRWGEEVGGGGKVARKEEEEEEGPWRGELPRMWAMKGIMVRVKHPTLEGGKYDGAKGTVRDVEGEEAIVKLKESGDVLALAPQFLQTSVPKPREHYVLGLAGELRGKAASLEKIYGEENTGKLRTLAEDPVTVRGVPFDHFARIDLDWVLKYVRKHDAAQLGWSVPPQLLEAPPS